MKHTLVRSILTPALALALPCLAFAQAGSSTPSSKPQDRSTSSPGYTTSDVNVGSLQRITSDNLDNQLTAKTLIGTDVHGSDGKKIGEVVDIVLAPSLSGKVGTRMGSDYTGSTGSTSSASRSATAQSSASSQTNAAGTRPSDAADARSAMGAMHGMQPAVIVSTGGLMGIGNDLVRVPMSKISYDSDKKEVRLNVTEDEWKTLREARAIGVTSTTR